MIKFIFYVAVGLQEATGELVEKLSRATEDRKKHLQREVYPTDQDNINPQAAVGFTSEPFEFEYTFKVNMHSPWYTA